MVERAFHKFGQKLLQKSVFPQLKEYLLRKNTPAPISINLDLTSACSNRCDYCIDKKVLNIGKSLDIQYIKKLVGDWAERGLKSVIVIGGGEPTMHRHFEEVIKFLKGLSLQVGIVSNGTQIEKIRNICHLLGRKDWVRFSLDAGRDQTFQNLHHPQLKVTLDGILFGAKEIRRENADLQMGYSFLIIGDGRYVNNIKEINLAAKSAKEAGFNYFSLKPLITPDTSRKTEISQKNLEEIKKEIKEAKKLEDDNFKVVESINLLCFYDEKMKKLMQKLPKTCHVQHFRSVVNPDGIFACSSWRGFDNLRVTKDKRAASDFNAKEVCRQVQCIYAPLNCWIEKLIKSPEKIKELKSIADIPDFFL
ncbi:MAG: radical SAM protein [Candidatus Nealsonbacteria bacterium]